MGLGIVGIICAASYLFYINYEMYDRNKFYYAENEDGSRTARPKTSRWDSWIFPLVIITLLDVQITM